MLALLTTVVWAVVVLVAAHRLEQAVLAIADDWIKNHYAARPARQQVTDIARQPEYLRRTDIEIPDDLLALAMSESEAWAQEDVRQSMKDRFLEYHTGDSAATWQKVRRAFGVGELP